MRPMVYMIDFFKKSFRSFINWQKEAQEQEKQKIADANARHIQEKRDWIDRAIIRKQLPIALEKLPAWQNVCPESVSLNDADLCGTMVYRVSKRDISKRMSITVCTELADALNSSFLQMRFEAYEALNYSYQEAVFSIHSALAELSARSDWETPRVQAEFQAKRTDIYSRYALAYQHRVPYLVLLQVLGIEDTGNFLIMSVKIADESEYHRWHPQALPFC